MDPIEARIATMTANRDRLNELQIVHKRLHDARKSLENTDHKNLPESIVDDLRTLTSRIEDSEWRAEQAVIEAKRSAE